MTIEEIIEALGNIIDLLYDMEGCASNFSNVNRCNDARHKLEDVVKQMQELRLPSGLDEAAEEYAYNLQLLPDIPLRILVKAFKAGAQWMAEQGETQKGEIKIRFSGQLIVEAPVYNDGDFKLGDNVTVQIRRAE